MPAATSNPISVTVSGPPTCATPTFDPPAGTYSGTQDVAISTTTPGATIYFTDDGTDPTFPVSGTTMLYTGAVSVSSSQTLKAIAEEAGYLNSAIGEADYIINAGGPLVLAPIVQSSFGAPTHNQNALTWSGGPLADHYDVWVDIGLLGFSFLTTVSGATFNYDHSGLASGWANGEYDYFVLAKDSGDNTIATSNTETTIWAQSLTFTITVGTNSTGPIEPFYGVGVGTGWYDGSTNGGHATGAVSPHPPVFGGSPVTCMSAQIPAAYPNTVVFCIGITGIPQDFFSNITFTDQHGNAYNLSSAAASFDNTGSIAVNSSCWQWPAIAPNPFTFTNYPITVNP